MFNSLFVRGFKNWEKYADHALPPLMLFYSIIIKKAALLILERELATLKNINFPLLFSQLSIFLTATLWMGGGGGAAIIIT